MRCLSIVEGQLTQQTFFSFKETEPRGKYTKKNFPLKYVENIPKPTQDSVPDSEGNDRHTCR